MALRCRIASLVIALMWAVGCSNTGPSSGNQNLGNPPSSFTYSMNPAVYVVGIEIPPNSPSLDGFADEFSIQPSELPDGLRFDFDTGVISGTPTMVSPEQSYVITAVSPAGSAVVTLSIRIVDQPQGDTGESP